MPPIKCILFDCDNTLVLSESAAFEACAMLANEILADFKVPVDRPYTGHELMTEFVGQNFRGMMTGLCQKHNFTIPADKFDAYVARELDAVIANLRAKAQPCEGVLPVLEKLARDGRYKLAIVSSSAMPRVVASVEKTNMDHFFGPADVGIFSAASSLDPPTSKPNPAIYLHAAKQLGFDVGECIAVEDSRSGATAAMRAGIPMLGYVGPYEEDGPEKVQQMVKVLGEDCQAFAVMHHWREFEGLLAQYEAGQLKSKY